jgi:uncharacterized protein (DUF362 family)
MIDLARRQFLGFAAALVAAQEKSGSEKVKESVTASATRAAVPRVGLVVSSFTGGQEMDGTKLPGLADPRPTDAQLTDAQLDALVQKALELGSMGRGTRRRGGSSQQPEDWVVLLVAGGNGTPGSGTDPRVVRSVLRTFAPRAKRLTIARGSSLELGGFSDEWQKLKEAVKAEAPATRIELLDLNEDAWLESPVFDTPIAKRNPLGVYAVSKTIRQCDMLVSVAPLATDPGLGVALTIANYLGIAPGSRYGYPKKQLLDGGEPEDVLMDLYSHQPARYAIAGGSLGVEGEGTSTVRYNVVIAGFNPTSVDAVGAAIMGFDPEKLPLLDKMMKRGFGTNDIYSIWTRGNEVDDIRRPFRKPVRWEKS